MIQDSAVDIPKHDKDPGTPQIMQMVYAKGTIDHKKLCKLQRDKKAEDSEKPPSFHVPMFWENDIPLANSSNKPQKKRKPVAATKKVPWHD